MMIRQNVLSTIMLKNVKLFYQNVKLQLTTTEMSQAINLSTNARNKLITPFLKSYFLLPLFSGKFNKIRSFFVFGTTLLLLIELILII